MCIVVINSRILHRIYKQALIWLSIAQKVCRVDMIIPASYLCFCICYIIYFDLLGEPAGRRATQNMMVNIQNQVWPGGEVPYKLHPELCKLTEDTMYIQ